MLTIHISNDEYSFGQTITERALEGLEIICESTPTNLLLCARRVWNSTETLCPRTDNIVFSKYYEQLQTFSFSLNTAAAIIHFQS